MGIKRKCCNEYKQAKLMKTIIPKDTRYVPLTQQKWCCVPTCIQMIMLKHNIPLVPAEVIGNSMGLTVPRSDLKFFWNGRSGKKPKSGWGTRAGEKQYSPNMILKKMNIPLQFEGNYLISQFKNLQEAREFLLEQEKEDADIFVCFDWGKLTGEKFSGGHVCLFDRFDLKKNEVRIIDPEYFSPKWRVVKLKKLYEAMEFHGELMSGGFWKMVKVEK
jgi:hypothetical protein